MAALGRFTCNICGAPNDSGAPISAQEEPTCTGCRSTIRYRAVILLLSRALFGLDLRLPDFPRMKSIRGLGFSDMECYASRLEDRFHYTNTFYDRAPVFDLLRPDESEFGKYDFVLCSEVLEHIPPPVDRAFRTLAQLLRPTGVLILTTPFAPADRSLELYPNLHDTALAEVNGKTVLVNRTADGQYEVFDDLVFHGGHGSTLEMRVFSDADLRAMLTAAGCGEVRIDVSGSREFGVVFSGPCSLPIAAGKAPFAVSASGVRELAGQLAEARAAIRTAHESRWLRLGRLLRLGPDFRSVLR